MKETWFFIVLLDNKHSKTYNLLTEKPYVQFINSVGFAWHLKNNLIAMFLGTDIRSVEGILDSLEGIGIETAHEQTCYSPKEKDSVCGFWWSPVEPAFHNWEEIVF